MSGGFLISAIRMEEVTLKERNVLHTDAKPNLLALASAKAKLIISSHS